jgi:hypothetical protein
MYPDSDTTLSQLTSFDEHLDWLVPNDMQVPDEDKRIEVGRSIRDIYTGGEDLADHVGDGVRVSTQTVSYQQNLASFCSTGATNPSHDQ